MQTSSFFRLLPSSKHIGFILSSIGFLLPFLIRFEGLSDAGHIALSIFFAAIALWVFESVPIYATSLLIILLQVLFLSTEGPILRAIPTIFEGYNAPSYSIFVGVLANPIIILFLGGFMLAEGAVKFNLDKSITRFLLRPFGTTPSFILLGLMIVTGVLSAFMSNTATTAMMLTVILPVIAGLRPDDKLRIGMVLAIPIAANIGGIATPIGTPPNAVAIASLAENGVHVTFTDWVIMALPLTAIMLLFSWQMLLRLYPTQEKNLLFEFKAPQKTTFHGMALYGVFAITVFLWMTESFHGVPTGLVAVIPIALLSLSGILDKDDIRKLPWEVLWLVAGGLALGISLNQTGLATWIISLVNWESFNALTLLFLFAVIAISLANFLSHTVTATLLVPLSVSLTMSSGDSMGPVLAGITIAVATSLSMVLPVSTPPNAIAISTGLVKTPDLAKSGIIIGVVGLLFIVLFAVFYWSLFQF